MFYPPIDSDDSSIEGDEVEGCAPAEKENADEPLVQHNVCTCAAAGRCAHAACVLVADRCAEVASAVFAAVPITLLNYATCTTYAFLIVEGTGLDPQLVAMMQLFSSAVTGACASHGYTGR